MSTSKFIKPASLVAVLISTFAGPALADVSYSQAEKLRASGAVLPQAKIVEIVNQARAGEITSMELDRDFGRLVYEVEVQDAEWREWDLEVDAKTGEVLGQQQDD